MGSRCIIPVESATGRGDTVVIEVQQNGSSLLDLRLVGCEGENPYVTSIKQHDIGKLKHKFKGHDEDWATVLSYFLLQEQPEQNQIGLLDNVRLVYTLNGSNLELFIRQDVQGIKVTLGEIILPRDEDFEFNPFDWAQASAQAHAQTLKDMADLKARVSNEQDTIAKLNSQLEDFIKTKTEAENAMLQQFMELLNEKKRKIRDQSRLLAGANVEKSTASTVQLNRAGEKTRKAGVSRTSKRKASLQVAEPGLKAESDSDKMEMDHVQNQEVNDEDEDAPEQVTPDASDEDSEGESESFVRQRRDKSSETVGSSSIVKDLKSEVADSKGVPPPRSLPFGRRATRSKDVEKPSATDDEDEETDDEEL